MSDEKLTLGEYFRRERELKGLDLKEIEERTKISAQTLIFLEEDQLDMLPPRTFLRGFLRVISKEFHFDEEELLAHLEETLASHEHKNKLAKDVSSRHKPILPLILFIAAVILVAVVIFAVSITKCGQETPEGQKTGGLHRAYAAACLQETDSTFS
jgi:cytoskeletal protein RodZ